MRYTLTWAERALQELAQIWQDHPDRLAVNQASHAFDRILVDQPQKGVDCGAYWSLRILPLEVYYVLSEDDRWCTFSAWR